MTRRDLDRLRSPAPESVSAGSGTTTGAGYGRIRIGPQRSCLPASTTRPSTTLPPSTRLPPVRSGRSLLTRRWSVNRPSACRTPSRPVRSSSTTPAVRVAAAIRSAALPGADARNDAVRVRAAVWPRRTGLPGVPRISKRPRPDRRPMGIRPSRSPHGTIRAAAPKRKRAARSR